MRMLFFVFFSIISSFVVAQEESLVTIYGTFPEGRGSGTGVVIKKISEAPQDGYYGRILTAAHVAEGRQLETLYTNGVKALRARLISKDSENDVAIIEGWIPNSIKPVTLAEKVEEGEEIFIYSPRGITRTKVSLLRKGEIYADTFVVQGDSGAPVLNNKKEVVGVVSGGSFWVDGRKLKIRETVLPNAKQEERVVTWPTRMGNIFSIRKIFK